MSQVLQEEEVFLRTPVIWLNISNSVTFLLIVGQLFSCIMIIICLWNMSKHKIHHCKQISTFKTTEMA